MMIGRKFEESRQGQEIITLMEPLIRSCGNHHVGGCHVPGLKDAPDPVGSEDLKRRFQKE